MQVSSLIMYLLNLGSYMELRSTHEFLICFVLQGTCASYFNRVCDILADVLVNRGVNLDALSNVNQMLI